MEAPLALYRRYRPETFAEVIGQDHVTAPLRNALSNNRVNHAYLFSGPRGCGKTTSARILARAINCEKGPIAEPCGVCKSCTDLARGGPGSIDVIEIDAASHGGVDDARDLRERAFFAPVESRYKIYIIDEAHMVTTQGFNALLKLVEEPPPHLKFIFATTEPDKVIGTIRSRTHHYPFRLVPPKALGDYMATLCEAEDVAIAPAALPLVVRAGAGSVRDSLSVLDQLIGGAGPEGVTYELAVALLGFTPDSLLDACVDGFAAHDSRAVFETVEKVIETGQDPKRFAEDLLRRLRDLVILSAVPNAVASGLIEAAEDQGERLQTQAAGIGAAELTRAADIVAAGLLEMRGATAPRLQLELICAKVLLPGADDSTNGIQARLDRMERRLTIGVPAGTAEAAPVAPAVPVARPGGAAAVDGRGSGPAEVAGPGAGRGAAAGAVGGPGGSGAGESAGAAGAAGGPGGAGANGSAGAGAPGAGGSADGRDAGAGGGSAAGDAGRGGTTAGAAGGSAPGGSADAAGAGAGGSGSGGGAGAGTAGGASPAGGNGGAGSAGAAAGGAGRGGSAPASTGSGGGNRTGAWADESGSAAAVSGGQSPAAAQVAPAAAAPVSTGPVGLADVRRLWPEVLEAVKSKRRFAWIMLSQNAQVIAVDDQILTLGLVNAGARESFARSGSDEILRQAMIDTIGLNRRVEAVVDPSTDPGAGSGAAPPPAPPSAPPSSSWDQAPPAGQPGAGGPGVGGSYGDGGAGGDGSGAAGYGDQGGAAGSHGGGAVGGSYSGGAGAAGAGTGGLGAGGSGDGGSGSGGVGADGPGAGPAAHEPPGDGAGVNGSAGYGEPGGTSGAAGDGFAGTGGAEVAGAGANGAGGAAGGGIAGPGAGAAAQEVSAGSGSGSAGSGIAGNGGVGSGSGGAGSGGAGNGGAGSGGAGSGGAGWGDGTAVGGPGPVGVGAAAGGAVAVQEIAGQVRVPLQADQQAGGPPAPSAAPEVDRREQAASKRRAAEAAVAAEQARKAAAAPEVQEVPLTPEEEAMAIGDDDVVLEEDSRSHTDLLRETLGASIINEEPN